MGSRWIIPTFAFSGFAALALGGRWILVAEAYGALVAVAGFVLMTTGGAILAALGTARRLPAAYRLTGLALLGWGGVFVFVLQRPYRLLPVSITVLCALVVIGCVLAMRRRPELSPLANGVELQRDDE